MVIWDTDYNSDNWEPEFMTIIVTWQLIVTLDIIRNSCDVLFLPSVRLVKSQWTGVLQVMHYRCGFVWSGPRVGRLSKCQMPAISIKMETLPQFFPRVGRLKMLAISIKMIGIGSIWKPTHSGEKIPNTSNVSQCPINRLARICFFNFWGFFRPQKGWKWGQPQSSVLSPQSSVKFSI